METGKELESLQLHLNTYYNTRKNIYFRPLTHEDLAIDGFYAVHHSDGIWYRLKLTIIKGTIAGKLIDFGLWSQIPLNRIQPLWPQFRNLPSRAIHASLCTRQYIDIGIIGIIGIKKRRKTGIQTGFSVLKVVARALQL